MPLNTEIQRGGKPLPVHWEQFHAAAMILATIADSGKPKPFEIPENSTLPIGWGDAFQLVNYDVIGATLLNAGRYILEKDYSFYSFESGEIFELKAGDELHMWRSWK